MSDLIVDVASARVLYAVLESDGRYRSIPVRALGAEGRVDLSEAQEAARMPEDPVKFRRASTLLGRRIPASQGAAPVATVQDFSFEPGTGEIRSVTVQTPEGRVQAGPELLGAFGGASRGR